MADHQIILIGTQSAISHIQKYRQMHPGNFLPKGLSESNFDTRMNSKTMSPASAANTTNRVPRTLQEPQKTGLSRSPAIASNNRVPKSRRPPTLPVKPATGLVRGGVLAKNKKDGLISKPHNRNLAGQADATAALNARKDTVASKQPIRNFASPSSTRLVSTTAAPSFRKETLASRQATQNLELPASAKPVIVPPEVDKWKAKYEEQLAEAERTRSELNQALANNETQREEISKLKSSEEKASAELAYYRDEFDKVEAQAKLAGKLQTDLNIAHHVVIPPLQEQNKILKQELDRLLTVPESAQEPKGLHKEPKMRSSANDRAKLSEKVITEQKDYIGTLEKINETLNEKYLKSVTEVSNQKTRYAILEGQKLDLESEAENHQNRIMQLTNDVTQLEAEKEGIELEIRSIANDASKANEASDHIKENRCAYLESQNSDLLAKAEDHENRIMQLTNDVAELEAEKEGLELQIRSMAREVSMNEPKSMSLDAHTPSQDAQSVAVVKKNPQVSMPTPTFSGAGNLRAQPIDKHPWEISSSGLTWVDLPQLNAHQSWPKPPLDKDLRITINVGATASGNMSLLKRIASITTKGTGFQINGPVEVAKALENGMKEAQIEADSEKTKNLELQKVIWEHVQEIERLKKQECSVAKHRSLSDQLTAMQAQFEMQELFLADYRRQLPESKTTK